MPALSCLLEDLAHALRRMLQRPALSLIPVLLVAAGIAASSTIFSVVDLVLFRSLPFPDSGRLVVVYSVQADQRLNPAAEKSWNRGAISWDGWRALQNTGLFDELGAFARARPMLGYPAEDIVEVWYASNSLLRALGSRASLGRLFTATEDSSSVSDVVLLTWESWQHRYGGRADILGQSATFTIFVGEPQVKTIVGVLAPGLRLWGETPEFVLPVGERASGPRRQDPAAYAIGRPKHGIDPGVLADVANAIVPRTLNRAQLVTARVASLRDEVLGSAVPPVWLLAATTATLILIACASAGSAFVTDIQLRRQEIAIRYALGARPGSLIRQFVVEHALKASVAVSLGLLVTWLLMPALAAAIPAELVRNLRLETKPFVVIIACATVAAAMLLSGVGPVLMCADAAPSSLLSGNKHWKTSKARNIQRAIAATQLALSLILLTCATLFAGTLGTLASQPLGFDPSRLAVIDIKVTEFPSVTPADSEWPVFSSWVYIEELLRQLKAVPGVVSAAGVGSAPFAGPMRTTRVVLPGHGAEAALDVQVQAVTSGYFQTMRTRILSGRGFYASDRQSNPEDVHVPVLVSEALARAVGQEPISKHLKSVRSGTTFEIVGVVENVKHRRLSDPELRTLYVLSSTYSAANHIVIRASRDPTDLFVPIRETIRHYDRAALVLDARPMEAWLAHSVAGERFRAVLSSLYGGAGLLLACCGVYALGVRLVDDRRHEIGVRAALGATSCEALKLVFTEGAQVVLSGVMVGVPVSVGIAYILRSFLFGASATAAIGLAAATAILFLATIVAMIRPALQAMRVDPSIVLRD
ncbi:MAG TPA: FtsX-like permease family protein [Steroidobacteraceae bacterium]|nr:FtsX-like permease family protein [Steroidobacteraceae bacterium]